MTSFLEKRYKLIIAIILTFMAVVSVLNAWWDGAIFDEDAHIPAGYSYVKFHDMRLNPEHPPLIKDLAGLFILPTNPKMDITKSYWTTDINGQWDAGHDLLWQQGNNANLIIFLGRLPVVIISLIFGWFIFKWVKEMAGTIAGLFALTIFAFDPNILGHDHFVTTDLGIAAFMTFSFYYFLRFIKDPTWKNVAIGGIFLGLEQLTKFSSITLFPIFGLVLLVYPLVKNSALGTENNWKYKFRSLGEYLWKGIIAFVISLVVVWGVYAVNIYKMPQQKLADTIEYYFAHDDAGASARITNKVAMTLNKTAVTRPLSEYFLGIAMVFKRVDGGNGAYFMEQVSGKAFRAYFPTVFALKEPIPTLALMFLALLIAIGGTIKAWARNFRWSYLSVYIRENIVSLSMLGFIILYAYVSITGNLNIGFRHLFPILPFAFILTAKAIAGFMKKMEKHSLVIWGSAITLLVIFLISETAAAYPAYMSYFNEIAGGPKNGYRYVTDSNADWGQDIKRLQVFLTAHPEMNPIRVNYFGGADVKYYLGNRYIDWWDSRRPIDPGWYAISTNYLMGSIYDTTKPDNESYRWIRDNNIQPLYQVGTSIFIYHLTKQDADLINQ